MPDWTTARLERRGTAGKFDWDIDACPHTGGGLAVSGEEMHAAVWTGKDGALGVYHTRSKDGDATWSDPKQLGDATASHPDIAASSDGKIAIVWDGHADNAQSPSILAAVSNDGGLNWSAISRLSAPGVRATHPRIVAAHGRFKVFWTEGKERYRLMTRDMF